MGPAAEKAVPYAKTSDVDYAKIRLVAAVFSDEGMIDTGSFVDPDSRRLPLCGCRPGRNRRPERTGFYD